MKMKHTPGPWEYGEERGCCREIHADNGPELYAIAQTFRLMSQWIAPAPPSPRQPAVSDHLSALQLRLSNERARLAAATRPGEIDLRRVWVAQIEKEIEQERVYVMPEARNIEMSDDELLEQLRN